uniref:Uncharacterized protein n=1 Tax=Vespula pensylvanica TaxID=30213 RepID=A0A834NLS5_VESPE|nr:hypothetical protein H0235_012805 [Vespula pensylvanica]
MSEEHEEGAISTGIEERLCYDKEETMRMVMVMVIVVVSNGVSLKRLKEQQERAKGHAIVELMRLKDKLLA